MPKPAGPFRHQSLPEVAKRLDIPEHQLRRAAKTGDVVVQTWAGTRWITPEEEERLRLMLTSVRPSVHPLRDRAR